MDIPSKRPDIVPLLLKWYDENVRSFPWRQTNDPYKIWLSEIMLQQTQVKTVIPYYNRWVAVFPNIKSVAVANTDSLLKMWEGLGYYARVRNFHSACKIIINKYSGEVPDSTKLLLTLPGVGPYIAGAIMSIAFNGPIPAIDSNALRVVSRLNTISGSLLVCKKRITRELSDIICNLRPGDFNQAIMDLGREICTSKNPSCNACPLEDNCSAAVNNNVDKYPAMRRSNNKPHYRVAAGIIWKNNKILVSKRKESGLLGGLWEFPGGKIKDGETAVKCIIREVQEELGVCVRPATFIKQIKHAYSHFSITLDAYHCDFINGIPQALGCEDWRWIFPEQIADLPFPKANHKLFDKIYEGLA